MRASRERDEREAREEGMKRRQSTNSPLRYSSSYPPRWRLCVSALLLPQLSRRARSESDEDAANLIRRDDGGAADATINLLGQGFCKLGQRHILRMLSRSSWEEEVVAIVAVLVEVLSQ